MLDLLTGKIITRPKVTECKMTNVIVEKVNEMAKERGLTVEERPGITILTRPLMRQSCPQIPQFPPELESRSRE